MTRRTVILVSPHFPPSAGAGAHRARHLAKHLPAAGWKPIVLCVEEAGHGERLDPALAALVPAEVEIVRARALSARVTRFAGVGDIGLRGFGGLRAALARLLTARPIGAVLMTGFPFYPMLLAPWIKRRFGAPVVLDFQDPWVSAWGANQPPWTKARFAHDLAAVLEPRAVRAADFITSVSSVQNEEMAARYGWLDPARMAAIPIGGDPDDFEHLRAHPLGAPEIAMEPGRIHLSYVGAFLPRAGALMRGVLAALALLREKEPELAHRLRLLFVGTSNQPGGAAAFRVRPLAEELGVADLVREFPRRAPYLDALHVLANSRAHLLIGSTEPHYTASKIFPTLLSGRPYLSVFHRASSAHAILSAAGGGRAFAFETPDDLAGLAPVLAGALRELALTPELAGKARLDAVAPYTAAAVARRFADVFERAAQCGGVSSEPYRTALRPAGRAP